MIRLGYVSSVIQLTDLRNVNPEVEKEELHLLKLILDEITCKEVVSFSFACGSYNYDLINHTFDRSYNLVHTTQPEIITFPLKRRSSIECL
jgi:hypothetical protein